jgi:hypothetical protein
MWVDRRADTSTRARNGTCVPTKQESELLWRKSGVTFGSDLIARGPD